LRKLPTLPFVCWNTIVITEIVTTGLVTKIPLVLVVEEMFQHCRNLGPQNLPWKGSSSLGHLLQPKLKLIYLVNTLQQAW
jgi:hypothetical protein